MEEFKKQLRELVIYTLPKECREDEDIVDAYFQSFFGAFEEFKNINIKYEELEEKVLDWANEKEILTKATPLTQIEKTQEELDETKEALFWDSRYVLQYENKKGKLVNTKEEIADGYGDQLVTLIIGARMNGLNLIDCLESAYNVISKRTGTMINGTFVKDERN